MADQLVLHTQEFDLGNLKKIWGQLQNSFKDGYITAEFFNENVFSLVKDLMALSVEDLISCRFFDGERQAKIRRIKDGVFWAAADFQPGGFSAKDQVLCFSEPRSIFLWGTFSADIDHIFEERIPYLFSPGLLGPSAELGEKDRPSVKILEFKDKYGNPLWDRFTGIEIWRGSHG